MKTNLQNKLDEIEKLAIEAEAIIAVTKASCEAHDYLQEETALEYALKLQNNLIERIINFNF